MCFFMFKGGVFIVILAGIVLSLLILAVEYWLKQGRKPNPSAVIPITSNGVNGTLKVTELEETGMSSSLEMRQQTNGFVRNV